MGPLQLVFTRYKIHHTGEQATHWDIQNKGKFKFDWMKSLFLDVPERSLLSSMADFEPCDYYLGSFLASRLSDCEQI